MKKILEIKDRGKTIFFRNRELRTPVTLTISDIELKALQNRMRMLDIQDWKVKDVPKDTIQIVEDDLIETDDVKVEELDDGDLTILGKLMKGGDCE